MRWKAGALVIGAAMTLAGLSTWIARHADAVDDRNRELELSASLAAVRLDAAISRAATTLALANADVSVERLAEAIGTPVCRRGERLTCAREDGSVVDEPVDGFRDRAAEQAEALAASASRESGRPGVAVVAPDADAPATAVLVVVQHTGIRTIAVLPLDAATVMPDPAGAGGDGTVATPLATDFAAGSWVALAMSDGDVGAFVGLSWAPGVAIVIGGAIAILAVAAIAGEQRRLRRRATTDALTGLPNRAEFERRAARRLTELGRDGRGACLIVVDLDGFKAINDSAGHAAGDRVLAEAGRRLAGAVRATDLVGRWGGDEFVLLLVGIGDPLAIPDRTAAIAACLSDLPARALAPSGGGRLTASVGAAVFPIQGRDLATLLELADRAMYEAKSRTSPALPWRT